MHLWFCRHVQLLLCADSPATDTLKLYCWDDPSPRAACYNPDATACQFAYSWAVTPLVTSTSPELGIAGDLLTVKGSALEDVAAVWLTASWGSLACQITSRGGNNVTCIIPEAPAGQYRVSTWYHRSVQSCCKHWPLQGLPISSSV